MAGPWEKYRSAAPVSAPKVDVGTGYMRTGPASAAPLAGGPEDPSTVARIQGIKTGIDTAAQERLIGIRTQAAINEARRRWEIENQPKPMPTPTAEQMRQARIDALDKINAARDAINLSKNSWFATGFLAPTMSNFGGTPAKTVQARTQTLKAGGSLKDIIAMSQANGGKNPLTPMSNSDVELIASGRGNLDIGQNDSAFQDEAAKYEDAYARGFQAAGGDPKHIEEALAWRRRTLAQQQGKRAGSAVIKYDANGSRIQ